MKCFKAPWTWTDRWNFRSLCRVGSIKYELDLVGVQEIRWEEEGY